MRPTRTFLSFALFLIISVAAFAADVITYRVTPNAEKKEFRVTMTIPRAASGKVTLQIPTWAPGSYRLGTWAGSIEKVEAKSAGKSLQVSHPSKLTWEVSDVQGELEVSYTVANADLEVANGAPKRGHIIGVRTFLYLADRKEEECRLELDLPAGWKAANSLDPVPASERRPNLKAYSAPTYDVLVDAPTEMGDYAEDNFSVKGVEHKVVLYGDYAHVDRKKLVEYCRNVAETQTSFMGDVPFNRYVFQFRARGPRGGGAGGLEHLGSTEISFAGPAGDGVRSVTAHEYFHLWNVKRIRPAILGPFDYSQPNRTTNLWWSEGVTSYYGDLLSHRGGLINEKEYLDHLAVTIARLQATPARLRTTVEAASTSVWEGNPFGGGDLSYYTKGELMGLCLDLAIRHETKGEKSLDEVLKYLYLLCGRGRWPGFEEDGIRIAINRVSGKNLTALYEDLARSTKEMPFKQCLGYVGLLLDEGTKVVRTAALGMFLTVASDGKGLQPGAISRDGAAAKAGITTTDRIVELDGKPVMSDKDLLTFRELKPGAKLKLTLDRAGKRISVEYVVGVNERKVWSIAADPAATAEQVRLRTAWLSGKPN